MRFSSTLSAKHTIHSPMLRVCRKNEKSHLVEGTYAGSWTLIVSRADNLQRLELSELREASQPD